MITKKLITEKNGTFELNCSDCALTVTFQVPRNASWKHCQEWQIDLPLMTISLLLWLLFFPCSKSNEEEDFRKAIQLYENDTTHRTKRGTKGQTSQVIDMQLCRLSITWYGISLAVGKEPWLSGVLFRGLPLWISIRFRADSNVCYGQKSWNCFFRHPFLWDLLAAMSYSLFRG